MVNALFNNVMSKNRVLKIDNWGLVYWEKKPVRIS